MMLNPWPSPGRYQGTALCLLLPLCVCCSSGVAVTVVAATLHSGDGAGTVTVPALPASLLFGTTAYFGSRYLLVPFIQATVVAHGLYF